MLRRPGPPLALALLGLVALVATGVLAKLVPAAEVSDARSLEGFTNLNRPRLTPWLDTVAHLADPRPYALAGLVLVLAAAVRGRVRVAVAIVVLFALTAVITRTLKIVLASPRVDTWLGRWPIGDASWPSGHATAAMTIALCAVLAVPPRLRPTVAALGAGFAIAIGYAILTLSWHFPSDVLGGYLVAGTCVLLALSALAAAERRWPAAARPEAPQRPADVLPALVLGAGALAVGAGVALARPRAALGYAQAHTAFVVVAGAIAVLGTLLALVVAVGYRRPMRRV